MINSEMFKEVTFRHLTQHTRDYAYILRINANVGPESDECHYRHENGIFIEIQKNDYQIDKSLINIVYSYEKKNESIYDLTLYEFYPGRPQAVRFDAIESDGHLEILDGSMDLVFHLP